MQNKQTVQNANDTAETNDAAPLRLSGDAAVAFVNSIKYPGKPNAYLLETMRKAHGKG